MSTQIPFNISGRTARLIGRENVSNPHGALIELIKNCYDADSTSVVIFLDILFDKVPDILSLELYQSLSRESSLIKEFYVEDKKNYTIDSKKIKDKPKAYIDLEIFFKSKNSLYIIDNGEGMSLDIIRKNWMTIGTDNKEIEHLTKKQRRVKTGAKGIGRFALDRLGKKCELVTFSEDKSKINSYKWWVSWDDFEKKDTVIGNVFAYYEEMKHNNYYNVLKESLTRFSDIDFKKIITDNLYRTGTFIRINELRDFWKERELDLLKENIETLLPPKEENIEYRVFLFSSNKNIEKQVGEILPTICDDFDYKLSLDFDAIYGKIKYTIYQSEVDISKAKKEYNSLIDKNIRNYFLETEVSDEIIFNQEKTYNKIPLRQLQKIGNFKFTFYFLKRGVSIDEKNHKHKEIATSKRRAWLDQFGGVRIYRDKFRVRPYGEKDSPSFDWLGFGPRQASNPAGIGRNNWTVGPSQIFGAVDISRVSNTELFDKSGREGIIENESFEILKNLLISFVEILELQRKKISNEMETLYKKKNPDKNKIEQAEKVIKNKKKKHEEKKYNNEKDEPIKEEDFQSVKEGFEQLQEEKEELKIENQILRGLASTGLTLATFTHELKNYKVSIKTKIKSLKKVINELIPADSLKGVKDYQNPFILMDELDATGQSISNWFEFTLESLKKDKRKLRSVNLYDEFSRLFNMWQPTLLKKSINLRIPKSQQKFMKKMYTIDFDSIFNNLIINSIYEFENRKDKKKEREIQIKLSASTKSQKAIITYEDSGPGLSREIKDPDDIFNNNFTTKTDEMGRKTGTGLGMWILKNTVKDYSGEVFILNPRPGFKIEISFPLKQGEGLI